jgi:hypothetical protein
MAKRQISQQFPRRYFSGLSKAKRAERQRELARRVKAARKGKPDYRPLKTDFDRKGKLLKTRKSGHVGKYERKYGPDAAKGVDGVAKTTRVPKRIIQQVYDRGAAAWATGGHRPGATQAAWAMARVYSFVTGGKTASTADADLAAEANESLKRRGHPTI